MTELTTKLQLDEESNHFHTTVPWTGASLIGLEKAPRSSGPSRATNSSAVWWPAGTKPRHPHLNNYSWRPAQAEPMSVGPVETPADDLPGCS